MTPTKHAGPLESVERKATCHCIVRQGGGAEEKAFNRGGIEGELGEGLSEISRTFGNIDGDWPSVLGNPQKARNI